MTLTEGKGPVNICANHVLEEDGDDDEDDDEEIEEDEEMAEVEAEVSHTISLSQPRNLENLNFQKRFINYVFEINVVKRWIRHRTTLNLNDVIFNREPFYVGSASFRNWFLK